MVFTTRLIVVFFCLQLFACSNVGETAPEFEFTTIDGEYISSESLEGKTIVLNVWATWCPTCIREIPDLNKLVTKYQNDTSVVFLALCDDEPEKMKWALDKFPFSYKHVVDTDKVSDKLQTRLVKTYPQNLIINDKMEIVFEVSDGSNDIFESIDSQLELLLSE